MKARDLVAVVVALGAIGGAAALLVEQLGTEPPPADPMALWVCDHCGREARAPLTNRSLDCGKCAEGQMVQRVFFRCRACMALFEAYQANWSPKAARAADIRKEADAHRTLAPECEEDPLLVRRPGGKWQWLDCNDATSLFFKHRCPECGREGLRPDFEKMLDPTRP